MIRDKRFLIITLSLCLSGMALFHFLPFMNSLLGTVFSFNQQSGFSFSFGKYAAVFRNEAFRLALGNTILFTLAAVATVNFFSFAIALLLSLMKARPRSLYVLLLPLAVPAIATNAVWGNILDEIGSSMLYGNEAIISMLVLFIWKYLGFHALIYLSGLRSIPKEHMEAAELDGAGALKRTFYIAVPDMTSFFVFNLIFSVIHSFKIFRDIYLLFGNYPPQNVYLLQHFIQNNFYNLNYDHVRTAAYLFFTIIVLFLLPLLHKERKDASHHET